MKPMRSSWLFLLAAVPVLAADAPSDRMTRIENGLRPDVTFEGDTPWTLEERMRHYGVPAVSIAVIQDFKVVAYRVYGVADLETGEKATGDTLFQAGSVSKPVAAFGALKMVANGTLTLDGNVNDTLKSWALPDNEFTKDASVTLTHLLAHTGGLTVHGFPGYAVGEDVPTTIQVLDGSGPANTPPVRVDKVPGESGRYSGGGYTIAQLMMVDAAGKPFPVLLDELVLKPVGMERSTFLNPLPSKWLKHAAAGYLPDHSAVEGKRHTYPEMAAAGLWTTAEDLARFAIEVQLALRADSDVLDRATAEKLVEPVTGGYGRGFALSRRDRTPYFGHGGWDEGFCASLTAHRTAGYGAVVMINSNHPQIADEIIRGIAQEYGWAGYDPYPKLEVPQAALDLYPGRYRYNMETAFTISTRGDRLFMQYAGGDAVEMNNVGEGRYLRRERPFPIMFTVENSVATFHFINLSGSHQSHQQMADDERAPREILIAEGYEKARPVYRRLFEESPDDPAISERWLNGQGLGMAAGERYEPAIGLLRIATELYPDSANTWDSVGEVYRQMGQLDRALQWYRKSLEVDPEFPSAVEAVAELEAELETNKAGADVDPYFVESYGVASNTGPEVITRNVLQDSKGAFWLATWNGIVRYDGTTFTNVTNKEGLRRYRAFCLLEDHQDNIWLGTTGAGVYRYDGSRYTNFTTNDGLVDDTVLSIMQDTDNNIWFGGMGLTKYDGTTFTSFTEEDGFTSSDVHSISQSPDGTMWFGTRGALFRYDGKTFMNFTEKHGVNIERNSYTPALVDQKGHVWFSGSNGLYHYDDARVRHLFQPASFSLMEDSHGHIWFSGGTLEGQVLKPGTTVLNRFDPAAGLENIQTSEQIEVKAAAVFGLSEDKHGNIWFGTGRGIGRIDGDTVHYGKTRQSPDLAQPTERNVAALLEQLQPDIIVVDGDPIETTTLAELMREHRVPGISIAVIRNGKIDWARGFGLADVETGRAVTPQTLFQAASISVPVAATAALSMVQDGLLDLDEDVTLKLKSWKLPTNAFTDQQPVTLRQLLSHTAGINVLGLPGYARTAKWPSTIDILEGRGNTDPVRVYSLPGTNWQYSDGGYVIIGLLMEDVAGKPYAEIVRERVFEPAGMTHSTYVQPLPLARESEAATAYARDGSAIKGRYRNYPEIGAAGLWTTAEDLARFALAIQQSRAGKPASLLSSRLAGEMLTPVMSRYGLGVHLSEDGERFGHGGTNRGFRIRGSNRGFRTRVSASIDDGWGIVVLTNGDGGSALCELVPMAAARAYGWPEDLLLDAYGTYGPTRRKRVDIGEAALARLAGTYEILPEWSHARSRVALFPNMGTLELKAMNGRLIADVPKGAGTEGRVEFLPQSELQLQERRAGLFMDFTVEDGQVTGFTFRGFEARRVD